MCLKHESVGLQKSQNNAHLDELARLWHHGLVAFGSGGQDLRGVSVADPVDVVI